MGSPKQSTLKRLFAVSSNQCAFPDCTNRLFDGAKLIADVCHIAGKNPRAKRYDPLQTEAQRQGFNNLIVLCPNHHRTIDDDEAKYTRPVLRDMKRVHEARSTEEFIVPDKTLERIALVLAGGVGGSAIAEIGREIGDVVRAIAEVLPKRKRARGGGASKPPSSEQLVANLATLLRFAPTGTFQVLGTDEAHQKLGAFFTEVFKAAGWRLVSGRIELDRKPDFECLTLFFIVQDRNHIDNVQQAILEVLAHCGFVPSDQGMSRKSASGYVLSVGTVVTMRS